MKQYLVGLLSLILFLNVNTAESVCIKYTDGTVANISIPNVPPDDVLKKIKEWQNIGGKKGVIQKLVVTLNPDGKSYNIDPVNEIYFYSNSLSVDVTSTTPEIFGTPGIGTWSYEYVSTDHYGNILPNEGIRFFLVSGNGISTDQGSLFFFSTTADHNLSPNADWYADYHDSAANTWTDNVSCSKCPEPSTISIFSIGFAVLSFSVRRKPYNNKTFFQRLDKTIRAA